MKPVKTYPGYPAKINVELVRNDTIQLKFRGWTKTGEPYDFTNHRFHMQIKRSRKKSEPAVVDIPHSSFSIERDEYGEEAEVYNVFVITHDKEHMDIEPGPYVFDIEMTDGIGTTQTIFKENNPLIVKPDVTQDE